MTLAALAALAFPTNPQEILQRSVESIEADWTEAPNYFYVERDVEGKGDAAETVKTYEVCTIEGSPYSQLIALNDQPLSFERRAKEARKLRQEVDQRQHEPQRERNTRIARAARERDQDHAMLRGMADAFNYTLVGDQTVGGHDVWVLEAASKPDYRPKNRDTKMLAGMKGTLWIDKTTDQWVKVEVQVIKPVSIWGFIAKVDPGTSFVLDQEPVSGSLWLPTHFSVKVNATVLGLIHRNYREEQTYSNYRVEGPPVVDRRSADAQRGTWTGKISDGICGA
jgi:hypothetical protein